MDGDPHFTATLFTEGLRASTRVYAYRFEELIDLFDDLARRWRGWEGQKRWSSLEGELALSCSCDRLGHIRIEIEMAFEPGEWSWWARRVLVTEVGQVEAIAEAVREFFGGRRSELR